MLVFVLFLAFAAIFALALEFLVFMMAARQVAADNKSARQAMTMLSIVSAISFTAIITLVLYIII